MAMSSRKFRVDDFLWEGAAKYSQQRGETVSDVIRRALAEYVAAAKIAEPSVTELIDKIMKMWPDESYSDVAESVRAGAHCFGIDLGALSDDDGEAIAAYASGFLNARRR